MEVRHGRQAGWTNGPATRRGMLRRALRERAQLLGTFSIVPSTHLIEMVALAGFDFVIVDMEHGPYTLGGVRSAVLAAAARRLPALVRVPTPDPTVIGAVLDVGADGVLVPRVHSAADAAAVVDAARFAPDGSRGANPYVRAADFSAGPDWFAEANRQVAVMIMVEGVAAVSDVTEILKVPGLDGVFLGPVDLSHSLGVPGQVDHPAVIDTLERVAGLAGAGGVGTGVFAADPARVPLWWRRGVPMVACGVDAALALGGLRACVQAARDRGPVPGSSSEDMPAASH